MIPLTNKICYRLSWGSAIFLGLVGWFLIGFGFTKCLYVKEVSLGVIISIFGVVMFVLGCKAIEILLEKSNH
jgi:hypothetical protein